jgi:hypothetical protein
LRQPGFADTFVAVAGLFSGDEMKAYAQLAIDFAKDVLLEMRAGDFEFRLLIGVAVGGPVICGLAGATEQAFVASGKMIEDAVSFAEMSSPNKILVSPQVRKLATETEIDPGGDDTKGYFVHIAIQDAPRNSDELVFTSLLSLPAVDDRS